MEHRGALNLLNLDHEGQVQEMIDLAETGQAQPAAGAALDHELAGGGAADVGPGAIRRPGCSWTRWASPATRRSMDCTATRRTGTSTWPSTASTPRRRSSSPSTMGSTTRSPTGRSLASSTRRGGRGRSAACSGCGRTGALSAHVRATSRNVKPSVRARDFEERVGARSAERVAIEDGAPAIREARSWREIHEALAEKGMRFERKGSGAILWVGDQPVKASSAGRDCSMSALQKRLGEFRPARDAARVMMRTRGPEPIMPSAPGWRQYIEARRQPLLERSRGRERQMEQQRKDRERMVARHRRERAEIFRGSWKGRGALLNATRNLLAARQAQEKAEQLDRRRLEREVLDKDRGPFPSYEEWLHQRNHGLAQGWRHRERRPPGIEGPTFVRPAPQDIRAFAPVVEGWHVHYRRIGERGSRAFTDRGKEIDIYDSNRRESVLAALQLSAQKWGTFTIRGNERFRSMCVELAAEHGFKIANPELQQAIAAERERIRIRGRERPTAPSADAAEIVATRTPADVYRRHLADVTRERSGRHVHPSRVDAEIAVRMRLTGHQRDEIVRAIKEAAPAIRLGETRDWDAYAKRTAAVAFGLPGDRLAEHLRPQDDRLHRLEGRLRDEAERLPLGDPFSRFGLGR